MYIDHHRFDCWLDCCSSLWLYWSQHDWHCSSHYFPLGTNISDHGLWTSDYTLLNRVPRQYARKYWRHHCLMWCIWRRSRRRAVPTSYPRRSPCRRHQFILGCLYDDHARGYVCTKQWCYCHDALCQSTCRILLLLLHFALWHLWKDLLCLLGHSCACSRWHECFPLCIRHCLWYSYPCLSRLDSTRSVYCDMLVGSWTRRHLGSYLVHPCL